MRLKEDFAYLNFGADGNASGPREGVFKDDTRFLKTYRWSFGECIQLLSSIHENTFRQHLALVGSDRAQSVGFERMLTMNGGGFSDNWTISNSSRVSQTVTATLEVEGEFLDLFSGALGGRSPQREITRVVDGGAVRMSSVAADGVVMSAEILAQFGDAPLCWTFLLAPGERRTLAVEVVLSGAPSPVASKLLPSYAEWRAGFAMTMPDPRHQRALERAVDDLRMLLLATPHGLYPAAGMPWFVNVFGRDALITAMMLQGARPTLSLDVLRLLSAHQGRNVDPFREEEPGKILHEMRRGELSRTGEIPFGRYYGSVDATPLFVMTLGAYVEQTGNTAVIAEFRPAWEAALSWIARHQHDDDGLIAFAPSGSGLTVQSWKDSPDSMNHRDGSSALAPLSVAEVQGYAFAAFRAAGEFYRHLGEADQAQAYEKRAQRLRDDFHARFWIDELATYAMALDSAGAPLMVLSSDPGHLLWSGIVPESIAPALVATLMSGALWSGWGLRTLGSGEVRYNPVSYHNGSVWPHDTALFAWGLARYGFTGELATVANALFDLAGSQPGDQLPELIAGVEREAGMPPTSYTAGCRPQAWAAAALPLIAGLLETTRASRT